MNKHIFAAGIAVAALLPSLAFAQTSCEQQRNARVTGTVAGAGIGALVGGAVAGREDRGKGAVIGAIGGALIGRQVTKPNADCQHAYGYYDNSGSWHANAVAQSNAAGYFDRNGEWVDGAPSGYYDSESRWVSQSGSGYTDRNGRWVPASTGGYYDDNGQWVTGVAPGYYDTNGRWVAGAAVGHYDANGRWISGQAAPGHRDANGYWISDPQPGYYENGRWRAGQAMGYYDTQGRFVQTSTVQRAPGAYQADERWNGAPDDFGSRRAWLEQRVRRGLSDGQLNRREANRVLESLRNLRQEERSLPHRNGQLRGRDEARLMAKLDGINDQLHWRDDQYDRRDDRRRD